MSIRLPSLEQQIDIDTSSLVRAIAMAKAFGAAMDDSLKSGDSRGLQAQLSGVRKEMTGLGRDADDTSARVRLLADSFDQFKESMRNSRAGINLLRGDLRNLNNDTKGLGDNLRSIGSSLGDIGASSNRSQSSISRLGSGVRDLARNSAEANAATNELSHNIDQIDSSARTSDLRGFGESISSLGRNSRDSVADVRALGSALDNTGDQSRGSVAAMETLASAINRLGHQISESQESLRAFGSKLDNLGDQSRGSVASVEVLASAANRVGSEARGSAVDAAAAAHEYKNMGQAARGSVGDLLAMAGAATLMNTVMAGGLLLKLATMGTMIAGIGGAVGIAGAGIGQLGLGVVGLGAALGPMISLAGAVPAALAGIGVLGATIFLALKSGNVELDAAKKKMGELGTAITTAVQNEASPAIAKLFDSVIAMKPALVDGFSVVAKSVAVVADQLTSFVSSSHFQKDFAGLMQTAGIQTKDFGSAAVSAVGAFTNIAVAGRPVAEEFSKKIAELARNFGLVTESARQGESWSRLTQMMQDGYDVAGQLVQVIRDLSLGFYHLGQLSKEVGLSDSLMAGFERGATAMRGFADKYRNELILPMQNSMKTFDALGHIISALGKALVLDLGSINIAPLLDSLAGLVTLIGKLAVPLGTGLASGLTSIITALTDESGPLQATAGVLGGMLDTLGKFGASVVTTVAGPLAQVSVQVSTFVSTLTSALADLLPSLTGPFVQIVTAARGMVDKLILAVEPIIKLFAQPIADALSLVGNAIGDTATKITGPLQSGIKDVLPALQGIFTNLVPPIAALIVKIAELASAFGTSFGGAVAAATSVLGVIVSALTAAATAAAGLPGPIKDVVIAFGALALLKKFNIVGTGGLFDTGEIKSAFKTMTSEIGQGLKGIEANATTTGGILRQVNSHMSADMDTRAFTAATTQMSDSTARLASTTGSDMTRFSSGISRGMSEAGQAMSPEHLNIAAIQASLRGMSSTAETETSRIPAAFRGAATGIGSATTDISRSMTGMRTAFTQSLPTDQVGALGNAFRTSSTGIVTDVGHITEATGRITPSLAGTAENAASTMGRFGTAFASAGTAVGNFSGKALGGLVSFLGGPWGVAMIGGMVALQLFGNAQRDAAAVEAAHVAQLQALRDTLNQVTGAVTALTTKKIGKDLIDKGLIDQIAQFGGTTGEAINAIAKGGPVFDTFKNKMVSSFVAGTEKSQAWHDAIDNGTNGAAILLQKYSTVAGVSLTNIAQAWASGGDAYNALAQRIASATGESVDTVKKGLEAISTTVDSTTNNSASKLRTIGDEFHDLGVSSDQVKTAFRGISDAATVSAQGIAGFSATSDQVFGALQKAQTTGMTVSAALKEIGVGGTAAATIIASLGDSVDPTTGKLTGLGAAAIAANAAMLLVVQNIAQGIPGAQSLADAFGVMADNAATAASKAQALADITDILSGKTKSLTDATFAQADAWDKAKGTIDELVKNNDGLGASIQSQNGILDAAKGPQRDFRTALSGITTANDTLLASTYATTLASSGQGAALDAVRGQAVQQRDSFIALLGTYGITGDAANTLANQMGLIPDDKVLSFSMGGTDKVVQGQIANIVAAIVNTPTGEVVMKMSDTSQAALDQLDQFGYTIRKGLHGEVVISKDGADAALGEVDQLRAKVTAMPKGTLTVDASSISQGAMKDLTDLGYKVTTLPDGQIQIVDDTVVAAQLSVDALKTQISGQLNGTVTVDADSVTADTIQKMKDLHYTVTTDPLTGKVTITSNAATIAAGLNAPAPAGLRGANGGAISFPGEVNVTSNVPAVAAPVGALQTQVATGATGAVSLTSNTPAIAAPVTTLMEQVIAGANGQVVIASNAPDVSAGVITLHTDVAGVTTVDAKVMFTDNTPTITANVASLKAYILTVDQPVITYTDNSATMTANAAMIAAAIAGLSGVITYTDNTPAITANAAALKAYIETIAPVITITDNIPDEMGKTAALIGLINAIPNKMFVITDNIGDELGRLFMLIALINAIPNKMFTVTDNIGAVLGQLFALIALINAIPDHVFTVVANIGKAVSDVAQLIQLIMRIPDKEFTVSANTGGAVNAINAVNGSISSIQNKTINIGVTADTGGAEAAINNAARGRTATITVVTVGAPAPAAAGAIFAAMRKGGITRPPIPMAEGGSTSFGGMVNRAKPMSSHHATIIPPNTPRLIGDNLSKRELFMPIDPNNARSVSLLVQGAHEMGFEVSRKRKKRPVGFAGGDIAVAMTRATSVNRDFLGNAQVRSIIVNQQAPVTPTSAAPEKPKQQSDPTKNVSFTFHQYNPQATSDAEMMNKGLQLVAAAGLI